MQTNASVKGFVVVVVVVCRAFILTPLTLSLATPLLLQPHPQIRFDVSTKTACIVVFSVVFSM